MGENNKLTSIRISGKTHERLNEMSAETGLSVRLIMDKMVMPILEEKIKEWQNARPDSDD